MSASAIAIFAGVLGSRPRSASRVHSAARNGADVMRTNGFTIWNHPAGTRKLPSWRRVCSEAKKFKEVLVCSNAIQNGIVNSMMMRRAARCRRSGAVRGGVARADESTRERLGRSPMPAR